MKNYKIKINENIYDVNVSSYEGNKVKLAVNGKQYEVEVDKSLEPIKTPQIVRTKSEPSTETHKATAKTSSPS